MLLTQNHEVEIDLKIDVEKVVIRATHCPHYLTFSYVQWYGQEECSGCYHKSHTPNRQLRSGPPHRR